MPRHDEFGDAAAYEKYGRSSKAGERDRYASEYSSAKRDRSRERESRQLPTREIEYQWSRRGKERESSPLDFNPKYMDDPEKHRNVESQRHQVAVKQVGGGHRVDTDNASRDNQNARADRDRAAIEGRDFAYSASESKHGGSRDKGKERRR